MQHETVQHAELRRRWRRLKPRQESQDFSAAWKPGAFAPCQARRPHEQQRPRNATVLTKDFPRFFRVKMEILRGFVCPIFPDTFSGG